MPLRTVLGLEHVAAIEVEGGTLEARVIVMDEYDAAWWDEHVQRYINELPFARADQKWIWPRILATRALVADLLLQQPIAYVVEVLDATGVFRPAVMLMLVDAYPYLPKHDLASVFVWYLSPAPRDYFVKELGIAPDKAPDSKELMRAGMDVALTESYNRRLTGRLGLHAAPRGGDKLLDWYKSPAEGERKSRGGGMKPLPPTSALPPGMRSAVGRVKLIIGGSLKKRNDGRYFYHDESTAFVASRSMDPCRRSGA
jgi:hypothetical protein